MQVSRASRKTRQTDKQGIEMILRLVVGLVVRLAGQYAASPLSLDHLSFRNYSRPTSPHRHLSLSVDPRSAPHTVLNTPDISPDRSAASTPGLSSLHGGSTRKTKYTRSRTGCLGCRVKRVKCDEGRPECKRCVTAKRSVSTGGCLFAYTRSRVGHWRLTSGSRMITLVRLSGGAGSAESHDQGVGGQEEAGFGGFDGRRRSSQREETR